MTVPLVGIRWGRLTQTGLTAMLASYSNTATTLTVNGVPYNAAWLEIGPDAPPALRAGYYAKIEVTGLSANTLYSWTLSRVGETRTGTIRSAPKQSDDFVMLAATCNRPGTSIGLNIPLGLGSAWPTMRAEIAAGACAILFPDDLFYIDDLFLTGMTGTPETSLKEYDYAHAWFAWFGISPDPDVDNQFIRDMDDCLINCAILPSWGDHEFTDNLYAASAATPNGMHTSAARTFDGKGRSAYTKLIAPLQGASIANRDTSAMHWAHDIGIVRVIAVDGISRAYNTGTSSASSAYHGSNQIDDVLDAANHAGSAFKLLMTYPEPRYINSPNLLAKFPNDTLTHTLTGGDGTPVVPPGIAGEASLVAEYKRLYVSDSGSPKSLMQNPYTNGQIGCTVLLKGDNHSGAWYHLRRPAAAGTLAEDIWVLNACGTHNQTHFQGSSAAVQGTVYDNAMFWWRSGVGGELLRAFVKINVYAKDRKMRIGMWHDPAPQLDTAALQEVAVRWFGVMEGTNQGGVDSASIQAPSQLTIGGAI